MSMKILLGSVLALLGILFTTPASAGNQASLGFGFGALYNGVGFNLAFPEDDDLKYVSLGCLAFGYSSSNGTFSNCGIGAGWMRSDILSSNGRHGLGVHVGITRNSDTDNDATEVFVGIPYSYFFRGMDAAGSNIGLTPILGRHNGSVGAGMLLNLGYQF